MATTNKSSPDRRKEHRVTIRKGTFDADFKYGRIIDISTSGMSFYYADRKPWPARETIRGTLCLETARPIKNLPVQTVADFELPNSFPPGSITLHRRSVRFGDLSYMQKQKLTDLIKQFELK